MCRMAVEKRKILSETAGNPVDGAGGWGYK